MGWEDWLGPLGLDGLGWVMAGGGTLGIVNSFRGGLLGKVSEDSGRCTISRRWASIQSANSAAWPRFRR
jgi:hypothetical protein